MSNALNAGAIDVVILCGGMGTRLQHVLKDKPKPMADFQNRPFLELLIDYVAKFGFKRFVLCSGHKGDFIKEYFDIKEDGKSYVISQEAFPLGTAGAIKNALPAIHSDVFLAMNGDSICPIDLNSLLSFHGSKNALASVVLAHLEDTSNYGSVSLGENDAIMSFDEKQDSPNSGWANAGIYIFNKKVLDHIPAGKKMSLEQEVFPSLTGKGLYGFTSTSQLLDIGTPERLEQARKYLTHFK
ncbi:MAG: nucleotidyltransferase family protein [Nitrospinota bacterium]|nr:nucleotidyltransferase family protein [Nitrospinota bacterium]